MREETTEKNASQEWALKNKMMFEGSREMSPEEGGVYLGTSCERIFQGGRLDGRILKRAGEELEWGSLENLDSLPKWHL